MTSPASDGLRRRSTIGRIFVSVFSFVVPGGGQALVGRLPRAVGIALASAAVAGLAIASFAKLPGAIGVWMALAIAIVWRSWSASDAYRISGSVRAGISRQRLPGVLLAFFAVVATVDGTTYSVGRQMLGGAWRLPSGSMGPALLAGDYVIAPPLRGEPRRGAIVAFASPTDSSQLFIKRILGGPGDTIEMKGRQLLLNGRVLPEAYAHYAEPDIDPSADEFAWQTAYLAKPIADYRPSRSTWGPLVVPAGDYFVLGDDRDNSFDSRYFGFIRRRAIRGLPTRIYFSRDGDSGRIRWTRIGAAVQER